ncbi:hypothetical protein ABNIH3_18581 [Acinetobacter baumannii ABNIH3]|nr:hypothetical protein ABNIH3_18581 [Acinetobacter baumannii ABNIH3]
MVQYLNQELVVSGKIDFENAEQQYQAGLAIIKKQTSFPLIVDLKQLEHGNTLALAVLVQWLRQTPQKSGLHFKNVPEKMLKIIQACRFARRPTFGLMSKDKKAPKFRCFFIYKICGGNLFKSIFSSGNK